MDEHVGIMDSHPVVSVYTCVYNGERTLHRVFESVQKLEYPNIEHIIINDGSTDKTHDMILEYISKTSYPVKYHVKENGGKHSALNVVWEIAEGYFMIQLDADDELLPHSVSFLVNTYFSIPEKVRDSYWCVHGRCVTQNGVFVGDRFPDDINDVDWRVASSRASKCSGEKIGLQVTKYLSKFRFPDVKGTHYISEDIIWKQINALYGTWYTNEVVRIYYVGEGGNLTARRTRRSQYGSIAYYNKWKIMHPELYKPSFKDKCYYALGYCISDRRYRKNNRYFEGLGMDAIVLFLLFPFAFVGSFAFRIIKGIK